MASLIRMMEVDGTGIYYRTSGYILNIGTWWSSSNGERAPYFSLLPLLSMIPIPSAGGPRVPNEAIRQKYRPALLVLLFLHLAVAGVRIYQLQIVNGVMSLLWIGGAYYVIVKWDMMLHYITMVGFIFGFNGFVSTLYLIERLTKVKAAPMFSFPIADSLLVAQPLLDALVAFVCWRVYEADKNLEGYVPVNSASAAPRYSTTYGSYSWVKGSGARRASSKCLTMVPSPPPPPPTVPSERPSSDGTVLTELPKSLDSAVMRQPMPVIEPGNEGILVGSPTTFDERIKDQSSSTGHPNLLAQYSELVLFYRYWRTVRGDGNCYYRALAYGFVEHSALFCPAALTTLVNKLAAMSDKGRSHPMFAGSYRVLSILLPSWRARLEAAAGDEEGEKRVLTEIHRAFNTPAIDQAFIAAIRLLVGDYLYRHKSEPCTAGADADCSFTWDQWAYGMMDAGIDGPGGFVDSAVLKMEEDASDLVQAAAPRALGCCVRIIMVHRDRTALHNIDYGDNSSEPQVHLLFQPGHYELLIPKQPERYAILPIIDDAALVPAGVPVQGPPQGSSSNEFEGFMQQVLTKYHSLWGQSRYLSSTLDQLLSRLDLHARPSSNAEPVDARSELTEMRNVLNNLVEAQRQLSAMPEDPMDEETPVLWASLLEIGGVGTPGTWRLYGSSPSQLQHPKGDGVNLKIEDGSEEALMDWPELQNSITPATASAGAFICGLCGKDGQLGGDEGDGVRAPCGDKIHEECLRKFIDDTIEKNGTPLQDIRCWQHERRSLLSKPPLLIAQGFPHRFGRAFLQANMRAPESTDDAEMKSDGTDVATADEPEGEEPTEKCVICNKPGDLGVRFPCGCPSHKKCLESSVENGVRNGQAPAEIECPEHTGRRLGVSFLESTVPAALEPVRSVWSGFSSRVAAVAAAANSNSNAGTVKPGPKAVRSGDRVDVAAKSEAHKVRTSPIAHSTLHPILSIFPGRTRQNSDAVSSGECAMVSKGGKL
ncbi:OTU domain, ubiquitin aldehyde binding [Perkinsus olseni]|uniref:ubiquitinyl hydrolase 1 n=1 Tax=Perkinsus olseni TaxID=32597 RepID=A0A7J6P8A7_PEROL|nr:OTU domain, ubiquitin aldehyde binding [Perkinsus olseni]